MYILNKTDEVLDFICKLPEISLKLEEQVNEKYDSGYFSENERNQVIEIVRHIGKQEQVEDYRIISGEFVRCIGKNLILTPRECGFDSDRFLYRYRFPAKQYMYSLMEKINEISPDVYFIFNHCNPFLDNRTKCNFVIEWLPKHN